MLFQSPDTPSPDTTLVKRPHEDDDDIEFTGAILPPDGVAYLGPPVKRRKRVKQEKSAEKEEQENEDEEEGQLQEVDETLREVDPLQRGCQACGCFCNTVGTAPKRSGSGSTTLSPRVLGDLLRKFSPDMADDRHAHGRRTQSSISRESKVPRYPNMGGYCREGRSQEGRL